METETNNKGFNILRGYNMLLYFAGTMIMYEPTEECIADFWAQGILKNLPVSSTNPNFIRAASQLRESCIDKNICGRSMQEDYMRLFKREYIPLAPPFESSFKNKIIPEKGHYDTNVTDFYSSYGWVSKFRDRIKDDHLSIELLFLTRLIENYLILDDEACQGEMRNEIRRFINQHIMSWVPEWNEKIQIHSKTLCYRGIASLIYACVEDINNLFIKTVAPDTHGLVKN